MKKLSQLLKEKRVEKKLSLEDIEKATKIKVRFLDAIENGNYLALPSESYAQGFVRNYALFLGIPEYKIAPLFRREYESKKIDYVPKFRKEQNKFNRHSIFSARGLLILGVVVLVAVFVLFQYSSLFLSPQLSISSPNDGEVISGNVVQVSGKTDPYATVFIDGSEVYVGLDGKFRKSLYEFTGSKRIIVAAENRFGKQTQKVINVQVQ